MATVAKQEKKVREVVVVRELIGVINPGDSLNIAAFRGVDEELEIGRGNTALVYQLGLKEV